MADVERIAPTVPTLPPPVGRGVGTRRRQEPQKDRKPRTEPDSSDRSDGDGPTDHIDEYV
jgi:hypothetical protein